MKRFIILLLMATVYGANAQQLKIYTDVDGYKYFALYAYGLSREVVKTNNEIRDSKFDGAGIMRRHHTTKYVDAAIGAQGYDCNRKMSFAFLIAPYNVDAAGNELKADRDQSEVSWYEASGWDVSIDTAPSVDPWGNASVTNNLGDGSKAADTPTGCAAYRGPNGTDAPGTWRLPTQREALTMFTIMEHALTMQGASSVTNNVINGKYWTSTELMTSAYWKAWYVDSGAGSIVHIEKVDARGVYSTAFARCVRDIDNDPINEH